MGSPKDHSPKQAAIEAWISGDLSHTGERRLLSHLDQCATCRDVANTARAYRRSVEDVQALSVPKLSWERISEQVISDSIPPPPSSSKRGTGH